MRANEFISEGVLDSMKSAGGNVRGKMSAMANSPTGQAVGDTLSKVGDWAKAKAYTNLGGLGGASGLGAATRQSFLDKFTSDYKRYMMSAKQGGMTPPSMENYVRNYIKKFGWTATEPQIADIVAGAAGDVGKLSNSMYALAQDQSYDGQGRILSRSRIGSGLGTDADSDEGSTSAQGNKLVTATTNLRSSKDLTMVAKAAMNKLNTVSPQRYSELRKEVQSGKNI